MIENNSSSPSDVISLNVAIVLFFAGWGLSLLLSPLFTASFIPDSYYKTCFTMIILELVFLLPLVVYVWKKRPGLSLKAVLGLSPLDKGIWLGLLFFTGGLLILFDALDRLLIHWVDIPQEYLSLMESLKWSRLDQAFLMIFAVSCVAPFAEETFFRGMLLNSLEHAFHKPFVAVILAAFIFAFVHAMPWYFLQIVLLGIVFGLLSSGLRSVWPAIFCHGAYNFFSMILLNLEKEPTWYSIKDQVRNGWIIIAGFLLWRGIVRLQPWFSLPKPASQKSSES